ncbi:hypothetical protein DN069_32960 [Streptacidiphilus pinicola]|uniref:NAD(P)-binding domain-containing protein n=1 Tax=Streptacidiphilus pinicola TaxID=2219663 RepID=A0A2X0K226_9ACTN|nr:hypothetical protein [Streptacidiphilus pinicola]RAG81390.1 hypothetical protein DN069_32960 [Streptacidiphilus pinicola]
MKIFLAGAGGAIGRRLVPLLRDAGHEAVGTSRSAEDARRVRALGAGAVVVDGKRTGREGWTVTLAPRQLKRSAVSRAPARRRRPGR